LGHSSPDAITLAAAALSPRPAGPEWLTEPSTRRADFSCTASTPSLPLKKARAPAAPADRPFRAADIALYHARHHGQPYAIYTPGMVHPAAADRRGPRLRDRRCAPQVARFDLAFFRRLVAGQVSSDVAHNDDIADLQNLLEVLDPATRHFGTDVADLVARCLDHGVLQLHSPLTHVRIEATTVGEYRDGGFLILVTIADAVTLTSAQIHPRDFTHRGDHTGEHVLAAVAETVCRLYGNYQALSTGGTRR